MINAEWVTGKVLDDTLSSEWNHLVDLSPTGTIFQRFGWISEWRRTRPATDDLAVLLMRHDGKLVGIAPLFIPTSGRWRYLRMLGEVNSDYCDILFDPDHEESVGKMAVKEMAAFCKRENLQGLIALDVPSDHLARHLRNSGYTPRRIGGDPCLYCPLPSSWDAFIAGLGSNARQKVPRYFRSVEKKYQVVYVDSHADPVERERAMNSLFELHTRYWHIKNQPGGFPPELRGLHLRLAAAEAGKLRLYEITLDGESRAVFYGYFYKGKMWAYLTGVDPDFAEDRLGTLIFGHAIRKTIEEGGDEFDFLRGDEGYKSQIWNVNRDRTNSSFVVPMTLRSRMVMRLSNGDSVPDLGPKSFVRLLRARLPF